LELNGDPLESSQGNLLAFDPGQQQAVFDLLAGNGRPGRLHRQDLQVQGPDALSEEVVFSLNFGQVANPQNTIEYGAIFSFDSDREQIRLAHGNLAPAPRRCPGPK
jgi:hypothetical protein